MLKSMAEPHFLGALRQGQGPQPSMCALWPRFPFSIYSGSPLSGRLWEHYSARAAMHSSVGSDVTPPCGTLPATMLNLAI